MLPFIPKPPITPGQKKAALVVAGIIDMLQVGVIPVNPVGYGLADFLDIVAAVILLAICGFKWQFCLAFLFELLPVAQIFPTWSAVVLMLPSEEPRVNVRPVSPPSPTTRSQAVEVEAVVMPPVQPGALKGSKAS